MKNKQFHTSYQLVSGYLWKLKWGKVFWKLCAIPYNIFFADSVSRILDAAAMGEVSAVVEKGVLLCTFVLGFQFFSMLINIMLEGRITIGVQRCRESFYERYFMQPLHRYQAGQVGDVLQNFGDDLDRCIAKELIDQPNLIAGCIASVCYLGYLASEHFGVAALLLLIALFQMIPPFLVARYLERFYVAVEEVEAQETECIIMGHKNLACIKMFHLEEWYIRHLGELIRKMVKIATWNQVALQTENSLDRTLESVLRYGSSIGLGIMVLAHSIPLDTAVLALALSGSLFSHVKSCFDTVPTLRVAKAAQNRLDGWFQYGSPGRGAGRTVKADEICIKNYPYVILKERGQKIDQINFCQGDKVALVGENGVGKTMLLKRIIGLLPEKYGCLRIGNKMPTELTDADLKAQFVYLGQSDPLLPITPEELFDHVAGEAGSQARTYAKAFGLDDALLAQKKISMLSGGERKKVYLSLAFALPREWKLLDEPSNNLDEEGKKKLKSFIHQDKSCIILVTHDQELVQGMDKVVSLYPVSCGSVKTGDGFI